MIGLDFPALRSIIQLYGTATRRGRDQMSDRRYNHHPAELGWDKDMVTLRVGFHDKSFCTLPSSLQNFAVQKILAI